MASKIEIIESLLTRCDLLAETLRLSMEHTLKGLRDTQNNYAEYVAYRQQLMENSINESKSQNNPTNISDV